MKYLILLLLLVGCDKPEDTRWGTVDSKTNAIELFPPPAPTQTLTYRTRRCPVGEPVTVSCCGDSKIKCVDSTTGGNLCDLKICITPDGWNYECDRRPVR